ncbi:MAG TPA: hypothetical protein VK742_09480 [Candidatus Sulfotelmatobacter sp.]|jgi:hypothetical protein|nr:hypothetical protein [Candidatus Sulfotelmatobacter sp.]
MTDRPKILLIALENFGTARLPRELQAAGFRVGIACRPEAFLAKTRFFEERFFFSRKDHGPGLMAALSGIASAWRPDWIQAMDDRTALFLASGARYKKHTALSKLLAKSTGNPEGVIAAVDKWRTWQAAEQTGIRVPATKVAGSLADMLKFGAQRGYPLVLKLAFSHAGMGVRICRDATEAETAWNRLYQRNSPIDRLYGWREKVRGRVLDDFWHPASREILASEFIAGRPAMVQAVALEGRTLGLLMAVAEETFPRAVNPASVVRFIRHDEMRNAVEKLIAHWKLSGFIAFDFVLDTDNRAWFLECNPRPIPISHLGALAGEDLCRRLYAALTSTPPPVEKNFQELSVAHFPREQRRDPDSEWLRRAFHDVPADEPELMAALLADHSATKTE